MPFYDVDWFRAITDQEVIHIQRTFNIRRDGLNDRVNFQTKKSNREDTALRNAHLLIIELRHMNLPLLESSCFEENFQWTNEHRQSAAQTCTVQVPHDSIFPCCVVSFFEVKEDGNSVLPLDKSLANECFEANKMISSTAVFTKSTLDMAEKPVFF